MIKVSKRKSGAAMVEYFFIALFFGIVLAFAFIKMKPEIFRSMFERSVDPGTTTAADGTLQMKPLGE